MKTGNACFAEHVSPSVGCLTLVLPHWNHLKMVLSLLHCTFMDNLKPNVSTYYRFKRNVDLFVLFATLPVTGLVILLFMFLTWLTSKGPVIYTQIRCTKDGKPFRMYKIRSMVVDAEAKGEAVWAGKSDPRITAIGKIMRKLHIDELPQIVNVWRGEMTVI